MLTIEAGRPLALAAVAELYMYPGNYWHRCSLVATGTSLVCLCRDVNTQTPRLPRIVGRIQYSPVVSNLLTSWHPLILHAIIIHGKIHDVLKCGW